MFKSTASLQFSNEGDNLHRLEEPPPEGWIKLNSDGACKGNGEYSGCGDLFRDSERIWLKGYIRKIEICDALHAEIWGMYIGLEMAWREPSTHCRK